MITLTLANAQEFFEVALADQGVPVYFSNRLGEDYGRYQDNGVIYINSNLEGNDEEVLKTTVHETVHHLQLTKGIWIGEQSPNYWNPAITEDQSKLIEEIVKSSYPKSEWCMEIPAWSLQYDPMTVYEALIA